jgi:formate-dependent nitrite reductase cytochrome c552 subunit
MERRNWLGLAVALSLAFASVGCEGDQGPQGPPGEPGEPGQDFSQYTYQGNFGEACNHCHATNVGNVFTTNHRFAYDDLGDSQGNLYCLQCHTTGFDSHVEFGDTAIADENRGPDENGYDDYYGVDTEEAAERRLALEGVQCESCHGPMGPDFNAHKPDISFSTHIDPATGESTSLCVKCHTTQVGEWAESGHANAAGGDIDAFNQEHYAHVGSCQGCHTSEGFIKNKDPRYATYDFGHEVSFIGCPTCHDPHMGEAAGNYAQLRDTSAVAVLYSYPWLEDDPEVPRMEGYGAAQTCAQCHHGRRDTDNVEGQIANGYAHFGPHLSPQMDMFIGAGSYQIRDPAYVYDGDHGHQDINDGCVKCHMVRKTEMHGEVVDHAFHTWQPTVGNCEPCHIGIPDFNVSGVQTTVQEKLDELAALFGYVDWHDLETNWDSEAAGVLVWEREAIYAGFFVYEDGSMGIHNPTYALSLLGNAIAYARANQPPPATN